MVKEKCKHEWRKGVNRTVYNNVSGFFCIHCLAYAMVIHHKDNTIELEIKEFKN